MERRAHWNQVYTTKSEHEVSWFEALLQISRELLDAAGMTAQSCVLDVGGGDSRLVDALTARGLDCLAVLDVSGAALQAHLLDTLKPGGAAIVATFAPDGPNQCSGLPVDRYSPGQLARELGPAFELREARAHVNTTPWGSTQSFQYSRLHRRQ